MLVENGHDHNSLLTIVNEKYCHKSETVNDSNTQNTVKLLWVLRMQISFHPASNLNNILCNIKSKFIPNSYSGLYQFGCNCGG